MELTILEQKIIKTLARFDVLNRPLTFLELFNFLDQQISAEELQTQLSNSILKQFIKEKNGWYHLINRENLIDLKNERYRISSEKLKIAYQASKYLCHFPWIKGIAIYSSLALKNSKDESDIDLFFITTKNRVWSARLFINTVLKLMRLRPSEGNTKNKLCPSYFVDENHLNLSVANQENDYYYYYLGPASFVFLYEDPSIKNKFIHENNWVHKIMPNHIWPKSTSLNYKNIKIKQVLEKLLSPLNEKRIKKLQLMIMPAKYFKSCDGKKVILNEGIIKMHDNDKRKKFNFLFEEKIKKILNA